MDSIINAAQQALNKAKIELMRRPDSVFFITVCFSLKHIWDSSVKTAATNGIDIKFNPVFFMSLSAEERIFLLLHETCHVAYLHMARLQDRDPAKWNVAADHVINLMLIARGYRMPSMGLADIQYTGLSTEEVYNLLPKQDPEEVDMDIQPSPIEQDALDKHIEEIIVRASIQSKMQGDTPGTIPSDIEIFLDKLLKPKLPWNRILQKYIHSLSKNDYTFRVPNRRFFPQYHLPSLYSESLMNITIAVDTSGSVTDTDFNRFVSEIHSIFKMMKPEKINLIQFDKTIKSITEIKNISELSKVKFIGRGGTEIVPVIDWVNEHKPQLLLIFTDGEFYFRDASTKVNTVWLINNNKEFKSPFGKSIHYDI